MMKFFDPNNPNEGKKMIAAAALGLVALIILGYVFFGGSSKPATNTNANNIVRASPQPKPSTTSLITTMAGTIPPSDSPDDCSQCREVKYDGTIPPVSEANRNIFAYYIPPSPTPRPPPAQPQPSPPPPPPITLSG